MAEYVKGEASSKAEFVALCKQLGIKGDKIKRELVERIQELPEIYDKVLITLFAKFLYYFYKQSVP